MAAMELPSSEAGEEEEKEEEEEAALSSVQKTVEIPQLHCRRLLLHCGGRFSWSRLFSRPLSIHSCCTFQVVDAPVVLLVMPP